MEHSRLSRRLFSAGAISFFFAYVQPKRVDGSERRKTLPLSPVQREYITARNSHSHSHVHAIRDTTLVSSQFKKKNNEMSRLSSPHMLFVVVMRCIVIQFRTGTGKLCMRDAWRTLRVCLEYFFIFNSHFQSIWPLSLFVRLFFISIRHSISIRPQHFQQLCGTI